MDELQGGWFGTFCGYWSSSSLYKSVWQIGGKSRVFWKLGREMGIGSEARLNIETFFGSKSVQVLLSIIRRHFEPLRATCSLS